MIVYHWSWQCDYCNKRVESYQHFDHTDGTVIAVPSNMPHSPSGWQENV